MQNNGTIHHGPQTVQSNATLLDKVLIGLEDSQKARVLELVVRLNIDQEDPLWLIAIAIGQLQILVEDAPDDWQDLFGSFKEELEQWTTTNLKTLELVAEKGLLMQQLTTSSVQLADVSKHLAAACTALTQRLSTSEKSSLALSTTLRHSFSQMQTGLEQLTTQLKQQHSTLSKTIAATNERLDHKNSRNDKRWLWSLLTLIGVAVIGWQQQQVLSQMATLKQQSEWQLQNILRIACQAGVKDSESPECHSL